MKEELMVKAAHAIRALEQKTSQLQGENESLRESVSSLKEFEKKAQAANTVLQLIVDGEVDPEDAIEKFAEVSEMTEDEIKLILRKSDMDKLGHVKIASVDVSSDPLSAYLLGL